MQKGHGGNIYDLARRLGCEPFEIIDMSSNVKPLGSLRIILSGYPYKHLKLTVCLQERF